MGGSPQHVNASLNSLNNKDSNSLSQGKIMKMKRRRNTKMSRRSRKIAMKKTSSSRRGDGGLEGSRRLRNHEVARKVKALKKLVPHSSDTMGIDGLFSETADYILALETRVKLMKIMVKVLSVTASGADYGTDEN